MFCTSNEKNVHNHLKCSQLSMFCTSNEKNVHNHLKCSQTCRMFKLVTIYFPHGERIHILHTQSVLATFGGKKLTFVFTTSQSPI